MRSLLLIVALLLAQEGALAQDPFATHLKVFTDARSATLEPDAQARIDSALESLVATGDVRAVRPLASYLVETSHLEAKVLESVARSRENAASVRKRIAVLEKELSFLRLKEKAGDRTVGPQISRREEELQEKGRVLERQEASAAAAERGILFLRALRAKLADGCAKVLSGLKAGDVDAGLADVRAELDLGVRDEALFMVRIISGSGVPQAEDHLVEVLAHETIDAAVVRVAQLALATCLTGKGADALVRSWERDPDGAGITARHVLSLAAKRHLASLEEARAWAAKLK